MGREDVVGEVKGKDEVSVLRWMVLHMQEKVGPSPLARCPKLNDRSGPWTGAEERVCLTRICVETLCLETVPAPPS